jgi:predicted phosphodiesterase
MIAVFSDAHGNPPALRAILADIRRCGAVKLIFLGDALTGPDPRGTMDLLAASGCVPVSGNVEAWIIHGDVYQKPYPADELSVFTRDKMLWIADDIGKAHLDWILTWPDDHSEDGAYFIHDSPFDRQQERMLRDGGDPKGFLYHAKGLHEDSPESVFVDNASIVNNLGLKSVFFGHTHAPYIRVTDGVKFCNVGSVGFCLDVDPRPAWVSWEEDQTQIHHVEYDLAETVSILETSKFPHPDLEAYIYMLRTGNYWRTYRRRADDCHGPA